MKDRAAIRKSKGPSQYDGEILNIEQAADLLGVSVKTFQKVLHSEDLPARKIGREWKFSAAALIEWVGAGRSSEWRRSNDHEDSENSKGTRRTDGWKIALD
ncbi:MAG: helix-turn-helix domain-containing protein [Planctomycetota bacterium]